MKHEAKRSDELSLPTCSAFDEWWHTVGSGIVCGVYQDQHEHAHEVAKAAWGAAIYEIIDRTDGQIFFKQNS